MSDEEGHIGSLGRGFLKQSGEYFATGQSKIQLQPNKPNDPFEAFDQQQCSAPKEKDVNPLMLFKMTMNNEIVDKICDDRETELLRMVKKGDDNFLSKIAAPDLIAKFNVTGRGSRKNLLDYHIFKYSSEIMQLNMKQLRVHVERQQSIIRSRQRRAAQKTTSIPTLEVVQEVALTDAVTNNNFFSEEPVPATHALSTANTTFYEFPATIIPPSSFSNV
ncbi:uncharacterized protein LOC129808664 [Phlebotomus papatasi]|uniref:uncharacterized protein LOC129808664 n=1 Tax=Phlebotomus papatasi TaxID=29031 RepID=UPI0024845AC0|nr:uncharacterized protein LOC129808664 [Phlebotomus papatasi]